MSDLPEITPQKTNRTSLYLALLAILISLVGTGVSIFESKLLREQQTIMVEEKAASVWPYVELKINSTVHVLGYTIGARVVNKGIGPALLGDVILVYDGEQIPLGQISKVILDKHSGLEMSKMNLGKSEMLGVLSPDEEVDVFSVTFAVNDTNLDEVLSIADYLELSLCYCSIYGDCWEVGMEGKPKKIDECSARLEL